MIIRLLKISFIDPSQRAMMDCPFGFVVGASFSKTKELHQKVSGTI